NRRVDLDAGQRRVAHAQVRHGFAADVPPVELLDLPAHLPQHVIEPGAGRVQADVLDHEVAARYDQRGNGEEGGGGGVARNLDGLRMQLGFAANADHPLAACFLDRQVGSEATEHAL